MHLSVDLWWQVSRLWTPLHSIKHLSGASQSGDSASYPGDVIVASSVALGEPVIYVSSKCRISGEYYSFS